MRNRDMDQMSDQELSSLAAKVIEDTISGNMKAYEAQTQLRDILGNAVYRNSVNQR